jgi:zinc/manganese transport system permease protein
VILAAGALYVGSILVGANGGLLRRLLPQPHLEH